jgi:hypothetical protein
MGALLGSLRWDQSEDLTLNQNIFVERILPKLVHGTLSDTVMTDIGGPSSRVRTVGRR